MTTQEIIDSLKIRAAEAKEAMEISEASGYEEYDYHEGRYEAYSSMAAWLEAQFFVGSPISH